MKEGEAVSKMNKAESGTAFSFAPYNFIPFPEVPVPKPYAKKEESRIKDRFVPIFSSSFRSSGANRITNITRILLKICRKIKTLDFMSSSRTTK